MSTEPNYLLLILQLLGAIAILMYGMKVMSEALQKMAGPQLRHVLGAMTGNRVTGVLTGMFVTVSVQSSAATTVMTVSFVNAALLTLAQAISVIMGANIGTTLSAWIMSAGFSFNLAMVFWPAFLIGILLIQTGKHRYFGDFLFGISFLLFALYTLKATGEAMDLGNNDAVKEFFAGFNPKSYGTILLFLLIGAVLTALAQSSAALMAITMVLCSTGVLNIFQGIALVMGENIGTTVTANLAAMGGNVQARRAGLAHLFFNLFGVCWVLLVFFPFVRLACHFVGLDPNAETIDVSKLSFALAMFHTLFNVTNTLILIWFIPQIEKLVSKLIQPKPTVEDEESRLKFISSGIMKTPEISVLQAQKETHLFVERMLLMVEMTNDLVGNDADFDEKFARIQKYEGISDNMENEIGRYLGEVGEAHLSDDTKRKIRRMLRQIGELESIGDSCYNIARTLRRRKESEVVFTQKQQNSMGEMTSLVKQAMEEMQRVITGKTTDKNAAMFLESEINRLRDKLRQDTIADVDARLYSYASGTIFTDLVNEYEKLGDYIINIVESKLGSLKLEPNI
ncbi:MAG: Na/Pi cotransporter family protein [Bacteroidota bacterium]|nr:Na/Pi cotransporter family protein [Bacteroidota bacterium]